MTSMTCAHPSTVKFFFFPPVPPGPQTEYNNQQTKGWARRTPTDRITYSPELKKKTHRRGILLIFLAPSVLYRIRHSVLLCPSVQDKSLLRCEKDIIKTYREREGGFVGLIYLFLHAIFSHSRIETWKGRESRIL